MLMLTHLDNVEPLKCAHPCWLVPAITGGLRAICVLRVRVHCSEASSPRGVLPAAATSNDALAVPAAAALADAAPAPVRVLVESRC